MTRRALAATILGAALLAGACGVGPAPAASSAPAARGEPAFQRVLDRIGPDGSVDRDTALQAFAVAFGPPPGVRRPPGPSEPIPDGSGPLRWVLAHLGELTPAQRRAVLAVMPKPAGASAARADGTTLAASTGQTQFESLVNDAWTYWTARYPVASRLHPILGRSVTLNTQNVGTDDAYTVPLDAVGGQVAPVHQCDLYFNPRMLGQTAALRRETVFHEVFHCFQAQMVPDLAGYFRASHGWLIEGGAEWAGDSAVGAGPDGWWTVYFATPATPLFNRTYDAVGGFAHMEETGSDVIAQFPAAMQAVVGSGGDAGAFNALVASGSADRFFSTWPAGLFRKPALGADWDAHGADITSAAVRPSRLVAGNGGPNIAGEQVPAYANVDHTLTVTADVLSVSGGTYSRMRAASGTFDAAGLDAFYCTLGAACTCPPGSSMAAATFKPLDSGSYHLALGGGAAGSTYTQSSTSLAQFCQQGTTDACLYGTWRLSVPPRLPLPSNATIQRLDETMTITPDGLIRFDVDIVDTLRVSGGPTATAEVRGPAVIHVLAAGGVIEPKGADFSGWTVRATVGGIAISLPAAQFIGNIDASLTPVAYRCTGGSLVMTGQSGAQWIFVKA
jgi:hypothetical protein